MQMVINSSEIFQFGIFIGKIPFSVQPHQLLKNERLFGKHRQKKLPLSKKLGIMANISNVIITENAYIFMEYEF